MPDHGGKWRSFLRGSFGSGFPFGRYEEDWIITKATVPAGSRVITPGQLPWHTSGADLPRDADIPARSGNAPDVGVRYVFQCFQQFLQILLIGRVSPE